MCQVLERQQKTVLISSVSVTGSERILVPKRRSLVSGRGPVACCTDVAAAHHLPRKAHWLLVDHLCPKSDCRRTCPLQHPTFLTWGHKAKHPCCLMPDARGEQQKLGASRNDGTVPLCPELWGPWGKVEWDRDVLVWQTAHCCRLCTSHLKTHVPSCSRLFHSGARSCHSCCVLLPGSCISASTHAFQAVCKVSCFSLCFLYISKTLFFFKKKKKYVLLSQKEAVFLPEICFDINRNIWNGLPIYIQYCSTQLPVMLSWLHCRWSLE